MQKHWALFGQMSIVLIWVGLIFKIFPSKFSLRVAGVSVAEFITVRFQLYAEHDTGTRLGFSSWVYYCKISTLTEPFFALAIVLVSVAEFITVRFQPDRSGRRTGFRRVSVAEFITVRFQPDRCKRTEAVRDRSFSSWVYYCKISTSPAWIREINAPRVSVAEFITVRFQPVENRVEVLSLRVSVAEFITVRFQPVRMRASAYDST